ncbi:hypothetical protein [Halococcus saccharolyticus]|uniref:Uncharacterized protein n=1 Tax=Halococcus saccharolyticus DSM 5350 TaxID=1227455 RepID=M0MU45_9EURY|nr:hypothetical protein [Halococcus saccharolyticus]EMA47970.1 hypothetical protein C449_00820 [Halococcus saccharolyticus DSM 5350]
MSDGANSVEERLHDGYPVRERWEGDYDALGYQIVGDLSGHETDPITIHYDDAYEPVLGTFEGISKHNSWLSLANDGDWVTLRPDGHLSRGEPDNEGSMTVLGVAEKVVAWEHPDE